MKAEALFPLAHQRPYHLRIVKAHIEIDLSKRDKANSRKPPIQESRRLNDFKARWPKSVTQAGEAFMAQGHVAKRGNNMPAMIE